MSDTCGIEHLAPNCAGGGEKQRQKMNLVEKPLRKGSAAMGAGSIAVLSDHRFVPFEDSSTGTKSIPKL
jgi:hypothetical protein